VSVASAATECPVNFHQQFAPADITLQISQLGTGNTEAARHLPRHLFEIPRVPEIDANGTRMT
jgi:hypothetical protein